MAGLRALAERSRRARRNVLKPAGGDAGVGLHPGRLGGQQIGAPRRQPVVPAEPAVDDLLPVDGDHLVAEEPVECRI